MGRFRKRTASIKTSNIDCACRQLGCEQICHHHNWQLITKTTALAKDFHYIIKYIYVYCGWLVSKYTEEDDLYCARECVRGLVEVNKRERRGGEGSCHAQQLTRAHVRASEGQSQQKYLWLTLGTLFHLDQQLYIYMYINTYQQYIII